MSQHRAIVILAAGNSSRLGQPKQLVHWQGQPLLRYLAEQALATGLPVIVVLGASAEAIRPCLEGLPVTLAYNADWQAGMGSSVRCGVAQASDAAAVLLMVCDQPQVTTETLERILSAQAERCEPVIVASAYAGTLGVPALFHRSLFPELLGLSGQQGAKAIIQSHLSQVLAVPFQEGELDVDTPADLARISSDPGFPGQGASG